MADDPRDRKLPDSFPRDSPPAELGCLLFGLMHSLRQHILHVIAELDLTPAQAAALRNLGQAHSQQELAARLDVDASSVTYIADQLEDRRLLERQADPADRRVRLLRLTPEGEAVRQQLGTRAIHDAPLLLALAEDEQTTLRMLLAKTIEPRDFPTVPTFRPRVQ